MRKAFLPLLVVAGAMFAYAPIMIAHADYEASMGIVSKILYFHAPSGMVMLLSAMTFLPLPPYASVTKAPASFP